MAIITPNPKKRGFLLPPGCKDLIDLLHGPSPKASFQARVNGNIRARKVRVIGQRGAQLGVMAVADALKLARSQGVDLVEIAPRATPPVCRIIDYGKFRSELPKPRKTNS
jgi:translation initiation factor IF-3